MSEEQKDVDFWNGIFEKVTKDLSEGLEDARRREEERNFEIPVSPLETFPVQQKSMEDKRGNREEETIQRVILTPGSPYPEELAIAPFLYRFKRDDDQLEIWFVRSGHLGRVK